MKKYVVVGILLGVLLAGCGKKAELTEVKVPGKEKPPVENNKPEILEPLVPKRDPFMVVDGRAQQGQRGVVAQKGRDPFAVVANVVGVPQLPDEPVVPDSGEEKVPAPSGRVAVSLKTLDRCWLEVYVNGIRKLRTNVPVGQTHAWEGESVILQQVGRDHAVVLTVNGKNMGLLADFARKLDAAPFTDRELGVQITLDRRYTGGVLVGLKFSALNPE